MTRATRSSSIPRLVSLVATVAVWSSVAVPPAGAASTVRASGPEERRIRELQAERDRVRAEAARKAGQVDALKASDAEVTAALGTLSSSVSVTTARLEDAQRATEQAERELAAAQAAEADAEARLVALRDRIRQQAVDAYVSGGTEEQDWSIMSAASPVDAAHRRVVLQVRSSRNLDSVEGFREVQHELAVQRSAAEAASARATRLRGETQDRLAELQAAHAEQERLAADIDDRLDRELAEADSLSTLDSALAGQISQQQTALAQRVAAERRAAEAARAALARANVRASSGASSSGGSSGGGSSGGGMANTGGVGIVNVQGIRVHQSIASQLDALLNAARADGIVLSGGGYRDPAGQLAVRRNNCGGSHYQLYEAPASSCSPPTARPGRSMHEQGLAIDFTQGGRTLNRSSAGFQWLKANAGAYGFRNLPSEPWHWSTNGN